MQDRQCNSAREGVPKSKSVYSEIPVAATNRILLAGSRSRIDGLTVAMCFGCIWWMTQVHPTRMGKSLKNALLSWAELGGCQGCESCLTSAEAKSHPIPRMLIIRSSAHHARSNESTFLGSGSVFHSSFLADV